MILDRSGIQDAMKKEGWPIDKIQRWEMDSDYYVLPDTSWLMNKFPRWWSMVRKLLNLVGRPGLFVCTNFAKLCTALVNLLHYYSSKDDEGLAFGYIRYKIEGKDRHCICFSVVVEGIKYFEPQNSFLELTQNEKDSIYSVSI